MPTEPEREPRSLPSKPDLRHLKGQAKDLLRQGGAKSLADAQFRIAREYGFGSWPKLKSHVESLQEVGQLRAAIDADDLETVKSTMTRNPELHRAPLGYAENGPLTWVAECRGKPPTPERLAMAAWMIENGSDIHQGSDGPLMRASLLDDRIPMMELLVDHGADVNALWAGEYPIILAPCETLQPGALKWLIKQGAAEKYFPNCIGMLVATYWRNPAGKHECLEVFSAKGYRFPDTAPMALHRGRLDLLEACLDRDPSILYRTLSESEIYPGELGLNPGDGCCGAPLDGSTLLHVAVEHQEIDAAEWLTRRGANPNARASIDDGGFGGHTPLFHTTVTPITHSDSLARLLLQSGANPKARATFRVTGKHEHDEHVPDWREFNDVTAIGFAASFPRPELVNEAAISAIKEYGGSNLARRVHPRVASLVILSICAIGVQF